MKKIVLLFIIFPFLIFAQQKNLPLNREWGLNSERFILVDSASQAMNAVHTNFKPWIENEVLNYEKYYDENMYYYHPTGRKIRYDNNRNLLTRKIKYESLISIRDTVEKFHLTIDPLFNFELGKDIKDSLNEKLFKNTRGVLIKGDIGTKFSFESSFYENQATFLNYIDSFNDTFLVVPGQGRWKKFKINGYDYAMASGYVSYSPCNYFNFQAGHGKQFAGEGYRSLLLSDNSFNYPYARFTTSYKKFQYTNLYAIFINLNDGGVTRVPNTERLFQKKAGSFQLLSWNVHKRIQLGFFHGLIWKATDTLNKMYLSISYFNPIIFGSALQYGLGDAHNVLLGSTLKFKLTNSIFFYGQYMLDDIAKNRQKGSIRNKQGFQLGVKYFDVLKIKNLHLQIEYNQVRPYSYAQKKTAQNYSHYNQSLAHPLGANFKEAVLIWNYRAYDFFTELKFQKIWLGKDSTGRNYGNNIFLSENNAFYGVNSDINNQNQGMKTEVSYIDFKIGYLVNPSANMNIVAGISMRAEKNNFAALQNTNFIYIGIRTSLANIYYDF